ALSARADYAFHVSLDTSALTTYLDFFAPYTLLFQLTDGDGTANNSVQITNLLFGTGGSPAGSPTLSGGASGSLASGLTLTDTGFSNSLLEGFTPGSALEFDVHSTSNFAGGTPDQFAFSLLDGIGTPRLSTDPGGAFLTLDIDGSGTPSITTFDWSGYYGGLP